MKGSTLFGLAVASLAAKPAAASTAAPPTLIKGSWIDGLSGFPC